MLSCRQGRVRVRRRFRRSSSDSRERRPSSWPSSARCRERPIHCRQRRWQFGCRRRRGFAPWKDTTSEFALFATFRVYSQSSVKFVCWQMGLVKSFALWFHLSFVYILFSRKINSHLRALLFRFADFGINLFVERPNFGGSWQPRSGLRSF